MKNKVKEKLRNGAVTVGSWISSGSNTVAEAMAYAGFEWLIIDMEHSPISFETAQVLCQAIATTETLPFVRVHWNGPTLIKRALDIGVMGIMIPMVRSGEEALAAAKAAKYPPEGIRGIGAARAHKYGLEFSQYLQTANAEILVIVQIEHIEAAKRIDEILSVRGIDCVFIGPDDLSGSLGFVGNTDAPEVREAIETVARAAIKSKVPLGIQVPDAAAAIRWSERGFQFLGLGYDLGFLHDSCLEQLRKLGLSGKY